MVNFTVSYHNGRPCLTDLFKALFWVALALVWELICLAGRITKRSLVLCANFIMLISPQYLLEAKRSHGGRLLGACFWLTFSLWCIRDTAIKMMAGDTIWWWHWICLVTYLVIVVPCALAAVRKARNIQDAKWEQSDAL